MADVRVLELFCGLGGCAQALRHDPQAQLVGALDLAPHVLDVYRLNQPTHPTKQADLQFIKASALAAYEAELWWMSPPCQPYTVRGLQRDLEDRRARSLLHMLDQLEVLKPKMFAMENVAGFWESQARQRLLSSLERAGYEVRERLLCPTELGIPAQRERYYIVASLDGLAPVDAVEPQWRPLESFLDEDVSDYGPEIWLRPEDVERHGPGMRILSLPFEPETRTNCFTSAYAKTFRFAGSFLQLPDSRVRYFTPRELLRLLGFSEGYAFPAAYTLRQQYKYIGNSLSTFAVREALSALPALGRRASTL